MSRVAPDPMIQQIQAARAGVIAVLYPDVPTSTVGVTPIAYPQPFSNQSKSLTTTDAQETLAGTPSESPLAPVSFVTTTSQDSLMSFSPAAIETQPALDGSSSESPTVGVGFTTNVV